MFLLGAQFEGVNAVLSAFSTLPEELGRAGKETVRRTSLEVLREFRTNVGPPTLRKRSGHLAASTNASPPAKDALGEWTAAVGYRKGDVDKYAGVQEGVDKDGNYVDSTTIRAKGRVLAIPLEEALTSTGRPRFKGPKDFEGVNVLGGPGFWVKFPSGLFFVVASGHGKGARLHFLFQGLPSVTVKGKKPLKKAGEVGKARQREIALEEVALASRRAGL